MYLFNQWPLSRLQLKAILQNNFVTCELTQTVFNLVKTSADLLYFLGLKVLPLYNDLVLSRFSLLEAKCKSTLCSVHKVSVGCVKCNVSPVSARSVDVFLHAMLTVADPVQRRKKRPFKLDPLVRII